VNVVVIGKRLRASAMKLSGRFAFSNSSGRGQFTFTIHGDVYYEIHVVNPENAGQLVALRVPEHAVEGVPQVGDKLALTFLMGQVTSARKE